MKILAFDTSTNFLSIACLEGIEVKKRFHEDVGIRHSAILVPTIRDLLSDIGWDVNDIELIVVGLGPGSFTGLRIAVATVKGLAAVNGCKVAGVPTMDAMVMNSPEGALAVAPFMDARKRKIYTCLYNRGNDGYERRSEYSLIEAEAFLEGLEEPVLLFGDAVEAYKEIIDLSLNAEYTKDIDWHPKAEDIGRIGFEKYDEFKSTPEEIDPLYLHAKECNVEPSVLKRLKGFNTDRADLTD